MSPLIISDPTRIDARQLAELLESVGFGAATNYLAIPNFKDRMFAANMFGFFAIDRESEALAGYVRVLGDDFITSWVAEICVSPPLQGRGIGTQLMRAVIERFGHTAIYADAMFERTSLFAQCGIVPRRQLTACSRAPGVVALAGAA